MEIPEPHQCIFNKVVSNAITPAIIEVNGIAPGCFVFIGKIGTESSEIISFRPQMIINHIKDYCYSFSMAGIYQMLQGFCTTIRILNRKRKYTIIAPVP